MHSHAAADYEMQHHTDLLQPYVGVEDDLEPERAWALVFELYTEEEELVNVDQQNVEIY